MNAHQRRKDRRKHLAQERKDKLNKEKQNEKSQK